MNRLCRPVQVVDEVDQTVFILERLSLAGTFVLVDDLHPVVQKRQVLQTPEQVVVIELGVGEYLRIRLKGGLGAVPVGLFHLADVARRDSAFVFLLPDVTVAPNFDHAPLRKEIDHRHADPVQTARRLIRPLAELAAEFQDRHDPFQSRLFQIGVNLDRNPAAVVFDRDRAVAVDRHRNRIGEPGQRLVDRVVDDFGHQVVQTARAGVADIHRRTDPNVLAVA